jgi:hypothetical protein
LVFSYDSIKNNTIRTDRFIKHNGHDVQTDYDFYGNLHSNDENEFTFVHYNITELINGNKRFVVNVDLNDELNVMKSKKQDIREWKLNLSKPIIEFAYVEKIYNKLIDRLNDDKISISTIKKFISVIPYTEFVKNVYLSDLDILGRRQKICEYIKMQKDKLKSDLQEKNVLGLNWIVENPTTQLTSSVNPIIEEKGLWYGDYFVADNVLFTNLKLNQEDVSVGTTDTKKEAIFVQRKSENNVKDLEILPPSNEDSTDDSQNSDSVDDNVDDNVDDINEGECEEECEDDCGDDCEEKCKDDEGETESEEKCEDDEGETESEEEGEDDKGETESEEEGEEDEEKEFKSLRSPQKFKKSKYIGSSESEDD